MDPMGFGDKTSSSRILSVTFRMILGGVDLQVFTRKNQHTLLSSVLQQEKYKLKKGSEDLLNLKFQMAKHFSLIHPDW